MHLGSIDIWGYGMVIWLGTLRKFASACFQWARCTKGIRKAKCRIGRTLLFGKRRKSSLCGYKPLRRNHNKSKHLRKNLRRISPGRHIHQISTFTAASPLSPSGILDTHCRHCLPILELKQPEGKAHCGWSCCGSL